jgi:hypothetical protein
MRLLPLAAFVAALALYLSAGAAAPAPAPALVGPGAKARLEALKKRLPGIVQAWDKQFAVGFEFRLARLTGPAEANLTFRSKDQGYFVSVWLRYYDGRWTTDRSVVSWSAKFEHFTTAVHALMLAIDESEEG